MVRFILVIPDDPKLYLVGAGFYPAVTPHIWPANLPLPEGWRRLELADGPYDGITLGGMERMEEPESDE